MPFSFSSHTFLYAALVGACVLLLAFLVLRSTQVRDRRMRVLLALLRGAGLAILLWILSEPVHVEKMTPKHVRDHVLLLVDSSASMGIGTPQTRLGEVRKLIQAVAGDAGSDPRVGLYRFDSALSLPAIRTDALPPAPAGTATNLGQAMVSLLQATDAVGVAQLVVFSDGRIHDREQLGDAIRLARQRGVPVSTYAAGAGQRIVNVAIQNCLVERHAPPGSRVPLRVLIRTQNAAGANLVLTLKSKSGRALGEVRFDAAEGLAEQELILELGNRTDEYVLSLSPVANETTRVDNAFEFKVEVVDPKLRVLYMEGSNHKDVVWGRMEYEYLPEALLETGNIQVEVLTVDQQVASGGKLFRVQDPTRGYPVSRDELFQYDLVICSDINRSLFSAEQLEWTAELVSERGGGFCMIGGYTAFGAGGWDRTSWEQMIPMDMKTQSEGYVMEEFTPAIPEAVRNHAIWQIDTDTAKNARILDAHPAFKGTNLVNRAKPGAVVLALHPKRDMPIISVQAYGRGRTLAFTSDAAGGWGDYYQTRWGEGDHDNRYYRKFWVNAVRWLTQNSAAHRRTEVLGNTEAVTYHAGEAVKVRARILNPAAQETLESCRVAARFDGLNTPSVPLRFDRDKGEFCGELKLPAELTRKEIAVVFVAADAQGKPLGEDRILVHIPQVAMEFAEMNPDPDLLTQLARTTGGRAVQGQGDLDALLRTTAREQEEKTRYMAVPLWDRAWLWGLVVLLFAAEWFIRKRLRMG